MIAAAYSDVQDWCVGAITIKQTEVQLGKSPSEDELARYATAQALSKLNFMLLNLRNEFDTLTKALLNKKEGSASAGDDGGDQDIDPEILKRLASKLAYIDDQTFDD